MSLSEHAGPLWLHCMGCRLYIHENRTYVLSNSCAPRLYTCRERRPLWKAIVPKMIQMSCSRGIRRWTVYDGSGQHRREKAARVEFPIINGCIYTVPVHHTLINLARPYSSLSSQLGALSIQQIHCHFQLSVYKHIQFLVTPCNCVTKQSFLFYRIVILLATFCGALQMRYKKDQSPLYGMILHRDDCMLG